MKCDKLKAEPMVINDDYMALYYPKASVDAAIDELKTENESLLQQNRELCLALQVTFSKEEYDKQKAENAELKRKLQDQCISCPVKMQEDDVVAELKQKLEDAKATAYAESVDAGMRERRLKRALWLARARNARNMKAYENLDNYTSNHQSRNSRWNYISSQRYDCWFYAWEKVEHKCLKKAEAYK